MNDVQPSTWRALHEDAGRLLVRAIVTNAVATAAIAAFWIGGGAGPRSPLILCLSLGVLESGRSVAAWLRHRRRDPVEWQAAQPAAEEARLAERDELRTRIASSPAVLTIGVAALLVVCGAVELFGRGSPERLLQAAALVKPAVRAGQWWRLVSSTYLHLNVLHLAGNLIALFVLGRLCEAYVSRWRLPFVYAAAAVSGSIASCLFISAPSVGASGAIMGLAGYLITLSWLQPRALPALARAPIVSMTAATAVVGAFGAASIDNAAHAGGFAAGAIIAWLTRPRGGQVVEWHPSALDWAGKLSAALLVAGFVGCGYIMARVAPASASTRVTHARAVLGRRQNLPIVELTNDSDRVLEAYRVEIPSDRRVVETVWQDDCCFAATSGAQPVPPHERRVISLSPMELGFTLAPPKALVTLAMFDDGSFEGSAQARDTMIEQRRWVAADADYWLAAIEQEQSTIDLDGAIRRRMDERARLSPFGRPSAEGLDVAALLRVGRRPPAARADGLARARAGIEDVRRKLLQKTGPY